MNILYSLLLLLFLFPSFNSAQDADHYKAIVTSDAVPLKKLEAMDLVIGLSSPKDNAVYVDYSLQYIDLALKMDSISIVANKAMKLQHIIHTPQNNPKKIHSKHNSGNTVEFQFPLL